MSDYVLDDWDMNYIFEEAPVLVTKEEANVLYEYAISPEGYSSVECALVVEQESKYWSVDAWADTTGWDCRSGVNWYGPYDSVMGAVNQLSQEHRRALGFEHSPIPEDVYRDYEA